MAGKPKPRRYHAPARLEAAEQTRARILDEATQLLLQSGYAATTITAIAKRARVSAETIYKTFGGKPGLVRAIRERALAGAGAVHAEQRSDAMQASETNPRRVIREWAKLAAEVSPRVSPILLLVRDAAAHDADMAELQNELDDERLARMDQNAATLVRLGIASSHERTRDLLWLATSPEVYELMRQKRGWTIEAYQDLVEQMLAVALQA